MNNDLISREALKKQFENECVHNCYYCKLSKWDKKEACKYCGLIDNAPTVPQVTVFAENASKEEIEDFKQELEKVLERPQGEWIPDKKGGAEE